MAQETIIDIGDMISCLRLLIESHELRARMGAAGRARVMRQFTWERSAMEFEEVWKIQTERAKMATPSKSISLAYGEIFKHYPTTLISNETIIEPATYADYALEMCQNDDSEHSVACSHMLSLCQEAVEIKKLIDYTDNWAEGIICWLLKKGYLRIKHNKLEYAMLKVEKNAIAFNCTSTVKKITPEIDSNALALTRVALKCGVKAYWACFEASSLHLLSHPVLLQWDFNHFALLEYFDGEKYSVLDPGLGHMEMTLEEIEHHFTGMVLLTKATEDNNQQSVPVNSSSETGE